jgi:5-methylthioadenosine/S-adenosylhomocysteine deaminase
MQTRLEQLLQKQISRKEFLTTLGLGLVSILGFSTVLRLFEGKAQALEASSNTGDGRKTTAGAATVAAAGHHGQQRRRLIKGGYVLSMDERLGDIANGDVLVDNDKIVQVGRNLRPHGADVIDARDMIVMPGMIDNHRHAWEGIVRGAAAGFTFGQYFQRILLVVGARATPRDMYLGTLLSSYEAINAGVTTLFDWDNAAKTRQHAMAGVEALRDSNIRGIYGYGPPSSNVSGPHPVSQEDIDAVAAYIRRFPMLSMAIGTNSPELRLGTEDRFALDISRARALGVPIMMHCGFSGVAGPSIVQQLHDQGILGGDMTFLHANLLSVQDFALIAQAGGHVSSSPPVELQMGFGVPPLGKILEGGAKPTISVDIPTANSSDMFDQMRILLQTERNEQFRTVTPRPTALSLHARDMLSYITTNAAVSVMQGDKIGSLTPGKQADVVLVKSDNPATFLATPAELLVHYASPNDVDTVLVAGKMLKRSGKLVGVDLDRIKHEAEAANRRLLA